MIGGGKAGNIISPNPNTIAVAKAMVAPITVIILLGINPIGNILHVRILQNFNVDAMIILPVAGIVGLIAMGQSKKIVAYTTAGLNRMTGTVILLIGAGAIAGIVSKSNLSTVVVSGIKAAGISGTFLAPIAGILMGGAMASTSTGAIVTAGTFGKAILSMGVAPLSAAIMVHTGATVIDHLP
jgi:gluconate:H+ symporter, GntP family